MTTCLPQSPTTSEKLKHGSPKSPRISPDGRSGKTSPFDYRRIKRSPSSSSQNANTPPTSPTPPSTPKAQQKFVTITRKPETQESSPMMSFAVTPVTTSVQYSSPNMQNASPSPLLQSQPQAYQTKSIAIKSGDGLVRYSFDLEVDYITERLIAVSFPAGGLENQYRSNLRDVVRMLKSKHGDGYIVFNLSRRRHDIAKLNTEVRDLGWPNVLAPPLERLCSICKQIETWMKLSPNHVVVLHCKGSRGPIGVVVSAYMNYMNITSSTDSSVDRYAMKRFLEAKILPTMHPSQLRYVDYFSGLLTNSITINSAPLFLHHVVIHGVPNFDPSGGCRPFLRIYQGMQSVFTSGVYTVPEGTSRFAITPDKALPLRGDILLKCYHKKFRSTTRDTVFRCQFHTTAVMEYRLVFQKQELDDACTDARFPEFTKIELIFSSTPDALHGSDYMPGIEFPCEHIDDPLIRWDSYEHFNDIIEGPEDGGADLETSGSNNNNNMILDIPHSSAPDGSLYAQVKKTPSPEHCAAPPGSATKNPIKATLPNVQLTNGESSAPTPYVLSPEKAPPVGSTAKDGKKRQMDMRERIALDELLMGITGEGADGNAAVNTSVQWMTPPPSPDHKVLRRDPIEASTQPQTQTQRRIVSMSEDLRNAPIVSQYTKPKPEPVKEEVTEEPARTEESSPHKSNPSVEKVAASEAENPYAEITDAMQQQLQQKSQNANQRGLVQETITPVGQTSKEHAAPPMVNGGVPGRVEQHNPTYDLTPKGTNGQRTVPNGPLMQHGPLAPHGQVQNGGINLNPGQTSSPQVNYGNPGYTYNPHQGQNGGINLNPGQTSSPHGTVGIPGHNLAHNPGYNPGHNPGYNPGHNPGVGARSPHIAQMNGPVETPIVPNSASSRVTERTPNLSRLDNGPVTQPPSSINPHYEPRPLAARQGKIIVVRENSPNSPMSPQSPQNAAMRPQSPPNVPLGPQSPPVQFASPVVEVDSNGMDWFQKQQDRLKEKRDREYGRSIDFNSPTSQPPQSRNGPRFEQVTETFKPASINTSPRHRVRFEGDHIQNVPASSSYAAAPYSAASSAPVGSSGLASPTTTSPPVTAVQGSPVWLAQQQQKLQERQHSPVNYNTYTSTQTTPTYNAKGSSTLPSYTPVGSSKTPSYTPVGSSAPSTYNTVASSTPHSYKPVGSSAPQTYNTMGPTTTPIYNSMGSSTPDFATQRGPPPSPLSLSSDLEKSIEELGHMNHAKPSTTFMQRTVTTTTTNKEWEPHGRPLGRQHSDLSHDRVRDPVFQREVQEAPKTPGTPGTPGTPYDPVPPILTSPMLKGDGNCTDNMQQQRRIQSRSELASRVGATPFQKAPIYTSSNIVNANIAYSSSPVKMSPYTSSTASPSSDSGYKSASYQTSSSSNASSVSPIESSRNVTRYVGDDGSETTITNMTERRKKTIHVNPIMSRDGLYHYPAVPVTQWKQNAGPKPNNSLVSSSNSRVPSNHQSPINIRVNPYEEVDSFFPRNKSNDGTHDNKHQGNSSMPSRVSAANIRSPSSAFVPLTVSTSTGDHHYDTAIHSLSSSNSSASSNSSSTSSMPAVHHYHYPQPQLQYNPLLQSHNHSNSFHKDNNQQLASPNSSSRHSKEVVYTSSPVPKTHSLLKSVVGSTDLLLSPSSVPSLSHPSNRAPNEKLKVSFHPQEEVASPQPVISQKAPLHPPVPIKQGTNPNSKNPNQSNHNESNLKVEPPPRSSSVPPTLPSYDWVMNRIRELRKGTNNGPPGTGEGLLGYATNKPREEQYENSGRGVHSNSNANRVHFDLRDEVIASSRTPKGHGTNVSMSEVVQPVPHRPPAPETPNLASLPPKGNVRSRTPQDGATLARKPNLPRSHDELLSTNNASNRAYDVERWNNFGHSYNSGYHGKHHAASSVSSSASSSPVGAVQPKRSEEIRKAREAFFQQQSHSQPAPQKTERKVRTLNKQSVHVEAPNPASSVSINNTSQPPFNSVHAPVDTTNLNPAGGRGSFRRSVSNPGINELLASLETNNNEPPIGICEDTFSTLDDAVKMLSHWSSEIQKLNEPSTASSLSSGSANHNMHASDNSPTTHQHHQYLNSSMSPYDVRINNSSTPQQQTHQTQQSYGNNHNSYYSHPQNNQSYGSNHNSSYQQQTNQSFGSNHNSPSHRLTNHRPQATSTPIKSFDEVDLHIEEPMEAVIPKGLVKSRSPVFMDRSLSPPPTQTPKTTRPSRRTNSQSGYDSDTGIQQYYRPPRRRNMIDPSAEMWLRNPGGLPKRDIYGYRTGQEDEFWNRREGLKTKEEKAPQYDLSSSTESISGGNTPKFPVGPRAYANMTKTFIVNTGAPPHGPDQPLPLNPLMRRQDSDTFDNGPLPMPLGAAPMAGQGGEGYTPAVAPAPSQASPQGPVSTYTQKRVITVEERSAPPPEAPIKAATVPPVATKPSYKYTPAPPAASQRDLEDPLRQLEYVENEPWLGRTPILSPTPRVDSSEPWDLQLKVDMPGMTPAMTTKTSSAWTMGPDGTPIKTTTTTSQWSTKREMVRQPAVDIRPIEVDIRNMEEVRRPRRKVEREFVPQYQREVNAAPALPPSSEAPLPKPKTPPQPRVVPFNEPRPLSPPVARQPVMAPGVEPPITEVRLHGVELGPIQVVPIEAQVIIDRKGQYPTTERVPQGPNQVPYANVPYQQEPVKEYADIQPAPPASYGMAQQPAPTPSSYSTGQQVSPPQSYGMIQNTPQRAAISQPGQEPTTITRRVETQEITQRQQEAPLMSQQQPQELSQQAPPPTQEELSIEERMLNQPKPAVQYPTFSDRHRKAGNKTGPSDESLPNGSAGYRTLYDNRKGQRSSLGNEGQLPSPGALSGKSPLNGTVTPPTMSGRSTPSNFYYTQKISPYGSASSLADPSIDHVRFVKDLSAWWYKPNISRDDAINILKDKAPGTFIVRDSNSFPGAFGLALKVAQVPANATPKKGVDPQSELVRHFLIEPNARGVRLKGCVNEPIFSSLSALIYQHTLTQLALPIKLVLPDQVKGSRSHNADPTGTDSTDASLDPKSAAALLKQGAACQVLYIDSLDMESLTGSEAVREALTKVLEEKKKPESVVVNFKVSSKGITLTDTQRKLFFRRHYPVKSVLYCGMDPMTRKYPRKEGSDVADAKIFGFVARKPGSLTDNQCHLFADYELEQPASAIVSFVTKVLLGASSMSSVKTP